MIASLLKLLIDQHSSLDIIQEEFKNSLDLILSPSWAVKVSINKFETMIETPV